MLVVARVLNVRVERWLDLIRDLKPFRPPNNAGVGAAWVWSPWNERGGGCKLPMGPPTPQCNEEYSYYVRPLSHSLTQYEY